MNFKQFSIKNFLFFIIIWIIVGILLLFIYFIFNNKQLYRSIGKNIEELTFQIRSDDELINKLSNLFVELPNLYVVLTLDSNNTLLGSIYESNRISALAYQDILQYFKYNDNTWKNPRSSLYNNSYIMIYTTESKKKIFLFYSKNQEDPIYFAKQHRISIIIYFVIGFLIALSSKKEPPSPEEEVAKSIELKTNPSSYKQKIMNSTEEKSLTEEGNIYDDAYDLVNNSNTSYINQILIFDDQIKSLMNDIYYQYYCKQICFYTIENNKWKPLIYKIGKLIIKDSLSKQTIPQIILRTDPNQPEAIVDPNNFQMSVPAQTKSELIGTFHIIFEDRITLTEKIQVEVKQAIEAMSKNLILQYSFEKSTIDDETQFYTYPYLCTLLNEKIKNNKKIISVALEINHINSISLQSLYLWTRAIDKCVQDFLERALKIHDATSSYLIGRRSQNQFIILLEASASLITDQLPTLLKMAEERSKNCASVPIAVHGAIINPEKVDNVESYIRYIHHSLRQASNAK